MKSFVICALVFLLLATVVLNGLGWPVLVFAVLVGLLYPRLDDLITRLERKGFL